METWQTIRHLAAIGHSKRFIARTVGVSRDTVDAAIADENPPAYQRHSPAVDALEPYRDLLLAGLQRGLAGVRLLEDARKAGYTGARTTFYRFLATLREQPKTHYRRFETRPAEQAQFDWSIYTLSLGDTPTRIVIYSLVLGYSRRVHFFPSLREDLEAVLGGVETGIRHFGGACRFVVVDNARCMVLRHRGADLRFNQTFLTFCGYYSLQPIAATPVHPQTKGKVENPFRSLETRFLTGNIWRDFEHLEQELADFETRWETRIRQTTMVSPTVRFADEQSKLLPLPKAPFPGGPASLRRVGQDGLISFEAVRYCTPPGERVVRARPRQGRFLDLISPNGKLLIRHEIRPRGTPPVLVADCYPVGSARLRKAGLTELTQTLLTRYASHTECAQPFVDLVLARYASRPERVLAGMLALLEALPDAVAPGLLADAVLYKLCRPDDLAKLLARRFTPTSVPTTPPPAQDPALPALDVERPLQLYGRALPPEEGESS